MIMLSKRTLGAILLTAVLLAAGCSNAIPWRDEPTRSEWNLAFTLERNLIELTTLRIDGRGGRFLLASAAPQTIADPSFLDARSATVPVSFGSRTTRSVRIAAMPLEGTADALVGADVWRGGALTIDYKVGLATWQEEGIRTSYMHLYPYAGPPTVEVEVDGRRVPAIVDTTSPDTLVLPARVPRRAPARVRIADVDFGVVDVRYADVSTARIGNRLLSRFLVSIDYRRRIVGLWRDPRIPLSTTPPAATSEPAP